MNRNLQCRESQSMLSALKKSQTKFDITHTDNGIEHLQEHQDSRSGALIMGPGTWERAGLSW